MKKWGKDIPNGPTYVEDMPFEFLGKGKYTGYVNKTSKPQGLGRFVNQKSSIAEGQW